MILIQIREPLKNNVLNILETFAKLIHFSHLFQKILDNFQNFPAFREAQLSGATTRPTILAFPQNQNPV